MTFKEAATFKMPFGKYGGKTLDEIATDDDGLRYLDWIKCERDKDIELVDVALKTYLNDSAIKKELERL